MVDNDNIPLSGRSGRRRTGSLVQRDGIWQMQVIVDGRMIRRSLHTTDRREADARRHQLLADLGIGARDRAEALAGIRERLEDATSRMDRLADMDKDAQRRKAMEAKQLPLDRTWDAYLKSKSRPDSGVSTLRAYRLQWTFFCRWLAEQGVARLSQLSPELVDGFFDVLRDRKVSAGTWNSYLQLVKLVCRHLPASECIRPGCFDLIRRRLDVQEGHREFSQDVLMRLIAAAKGELKTLIILGAYTGLRLKDCCLLSWEDVDLGRGIIRILPAKTARRKRDPLLVPVHECLRQVLEETPADRRTGAVLPDLAAQYRRGRAGPPKMFQAFLRANGIETQRPRESGSLPVVVYGFHSLRHTAVTLLRESGASQAVAAAIVGHHSRAMSARYTHIGEDVLRSAVASMPALGEERKKNHVEKLRAAVIKAAATADEPALKKALRALD